MSHIMYRQFYPISPFSPTLTFPAQVNRQKSVLQASALNLATWIYKGPDVAIADVSGAHPKLEYCVIDRHTDDFDIDQATVVWDDNKTRYLALVFRGTLTLPNWIANLGCIPAKDRFARYGIWVHSGFHASISDVRKWEEIKAIITNEHETAEGTGFDFKLLVCGHSLGGAIAQVAAFILYDTLDPCISSDVACVTFASPMPFALDPRSPNEPVQQRGLKWLSDHCINFVNNNDMVPRLPGNLKFALHYVDCMVQEVADLLPLNDIPIISDILNIDRKAFDAKGLSFYKHLCRTVFIGHTIGQRLHMMLPSDAAFNEHLDIDPCCKDELEDKLPPKPPIAAQAGATLVGGAVGGVASSTKIAKAGVSTTNSVCGGDIATAIEAVEGAPVDVYETQSKTERLVRQLCTEYGRAKLLHDISLGVHASILDHKIEKYAHYIYYPDGQGTATNLEVKV